MGKSSYMEAAFNPVASTRVTVSYTHLDVYKRQDYVNGAVIPVDGGWLAR